MVARSKAMQICLFLSHLLPLQPPPLEEVGDLNAPRIPAPILLYRCCRLPGLRLLLLLLSCSNKRLPDRSRCLICQSGELGFSRVADEASGNDGDGDRVLKGGVDDGAEDKVRIGVNEVINDSSCLVHLRGWGS